MHRQFIALAWSFATGVASAQTTDDPWRAALSATDHVAVARATVKSHCRSEQFVAANQAYQTFCPKIDEIPDAILEQAALPYLRLHLNEQQARLATESWSSEAARELMKKSIKEIDSGVHDQLTAFDKDMIRKREHAEYGRALARFTGDRRQVYAMTLAMFRWVAKLSQGDVPPSAPGSTDPAPAEQDERGNIRKARVFHILVKDRWLAEQLLGQLRALPASTVLDAFKREAKANSIDLGTAQLGGHLGEIRQGDLESELDQAFATLAPNTLSTPLKSSYGWHVLFLTDVVDQPIRALCDAADAAMLARVKPDVRAQLEMGLGAQAGVELSPQLLALMGEGWSGALWTRAGTLKYMRAVTAESAHMVDVTLHAEYPYARYVKDRAACVRSSRLALKVNCANHMIGERSTLVYQGRAATGPAIAGDDFLVTAPALANPDQVSGQIAEFACQMAAKKLAP